MATYTVLISSRDRSSLSNSAADFHVEFNKTYDKIRTIKLLSYNIANTVYTVNSNNNRLRFVEGSTTVLVTLTNSNYTAPELAAHIADVMTSNSTVAATYTGTYDINLFKMTFTASTGNFYFDFNGLNKNCSQIIGFNENHIGTLASSQISQNAIRIDVNYVLLETDFQNNIETSAQGVKASWVLELPASGTSQTFNVNNTYDHQVDVNMTIRSMSIRLKNNKNYTIDMNGSDSYFLFEFSQK